jgi:hypothetical protein
MKSAIAALSAIVRARFDPTIAKQQVLVSGTGLLISIKFVALADVEDMPR